MIDWLNQPQDITQYQGFVYIIRSKVNDKKYIGQKQFWKVIKKQPLKGKTNKRHKRIETDWKEYWGSCNELLRDIETFGKEQFERRIIKCYKTKWECSYYEVVEQIKRNVLLSDEYYNGIINCRLCKWKGKE